MKYCKKCNLEKDISEYHRNKKIKDGLNNICKVCSLEEKRKYYQNNREKVKQKVKTYRQQNLEKVENNVKSYYSKNRDKLIEYKRNYYISNKDKMNNQSKEYRIKNYDKVEDKKKEYIYNRRKNDDLFAFKERISKLINTSIKNAGYKKSMRAEEILGCSIVQFKNYIQNQFKDGMSWDNKKDWHLDHKIPVSWAKNENEIIKLNHYTNFQPLWIGENLCKGNRWCD